MTSRFRRTPIAALAVSLLIGGVSNAIAQGMLLQRGESGVAVSGGYYSTKDLSGFAGAVGYSFRGIVDLGASVERSGIDRHVDPRTVIAYVDAESFARGPIAYPTSGHPRLDATAVCPSVAVHLRGPAHLPSLTIGASYERTWFGEWWSESLYGAESTTAKYAPILYDALESGTSLGATAYRQFALSPTASIVPHAGLAWNRGETTMTLRGYSYGYRQTSNLFVFPVGVHMLFRASSGTRVHVSPEAEFGTGGRRAFSVSAGIVMTRSPFRS